MKQERWLPLDEIAAHMEVNPGAAYKRTERKKLLDHRMGRLWKFKTTPVNAWVQAGKAAEQGREKK